MVVRKIKTKWIADAEITPCIAAKVQNTSKEYYIINIGTIA
jgi:hypothetical protein